MLPFREFGKPINPFGRVSSGDGGEHITSMSSRILSTQAANLIAYWQLNEATGTTAKDSSPTGANGAYAGSFALNQAGIGDGSPSVLFSGGRVDLTAAMVALNLAFLATAGTIFLWGKVSGSGVWTDGVARTLFELGADANNRMFIQKSNLTNQLNVSHRAGGTVKTFAPATSTTGNFAVGLTWDKVADQAMCYFNGVQNGATQNALGVFVGALAAGFSAIADFASTGSANNFTGNLAHVTAWKIALTAAEMARIGVLSAS